MVTYLSYLFDLDGTLYNRDDLVRSLIEEQQQEFRKELSHINADAYISRVVDLDAHGYFPKEQLYAQLGQELGLSENTQSNLLAHFWDRYDAHCAAPKDTLTTLQTLSERGVQLGIVTNGKTQRQNKKIDALGIRDYFHTIVISEAEGVKKPHPEIFASAVKRCGNPENNTVFIGDHPNADINGARNAGLAAIWKRVPYWDMKRPDVMVVDRLIEVLDA